jgi:hypothetical protein
MLGSNEWLEVEKRNSKTMENKNEPRSSQTHGESGNLNQQGQVARDNPQIAKQTLPVFTVPEL